MTASNAFFNSKQDWLSHTLEHASEALPNCHHDLPGGGTLVQLGTGILQINPPQSRHNTHQDAMIISAGIHGNETAPIEVLNQLVNELMSGALQPACPALLILGNPQAMVTGKRFTEANLNRLFSGAHQRDEYRKMPEAERAQQLEQLCQTFAEQTQAQGLALSHYDLHTAIRSSQREKFALYAFVPGRQVPATQCAFLLAAEVHTLLLQHKAGTTFASFSSSALNAESFTVELGQVKAFGQNDLSRFQGIRYALECRIGGLPAPDSAA
ncbi:MAG TPA: succinylglutamate desuccinylase, partial [Marinobacter sp.]|nr:succinylglutamate desuccinylase [Marinobacter sp.]